MTTAAPAPGPPFPSGPPSASGPPGPGGAGPVAGRPATLVAACALVLVHAVVALATTAVGLVGLANVAASRPGLRSSLVDLLPSILAQDLLALLLVAGSVVSAVFVWSGRRRARLTLTACSGLTLLAGVAGVVTLTGRGLPPSAAAVASTVLSAAVLVLVWLPATTAGLRPARAGRTGSVGPARPGA